MLKRFPDDLPLFGALLASLGYLAFGYSAVYATLHFGRPYSLIGLAMYFIPVWAGMYGIAGGLSGLLVRKLLARNPKFVADRFSLSRRWMPLALIGGICVGCVLGALTVLVNERRARPALLVDDGSIRQRLGGGDDRWVRSALPVFDGKTASASTVWGTNDSMILFYDRVVQFSDRFRARYADLDISGLDYITRIDAAPLIVDGPDKPWLVVVASGRATGRRAIIAVLAPDYGVAYQRRVERFWGLSPPPLEIRSDRTTGREIAVIGRGREQSLVLGGHEAIR